MAAGPANMFSTRAFIILFPAAASVAVAAEDYQRSLLLKGSNRHDSSTRRAQNVRQFNTPKRLKSRIRSNIRDVFPKNQGPSSKRIANITAVKNAYRILHNLTGSRCWITSQENGQQPLMREQLHEQLIRELARGFGYLQSLVTGFLDLLGPKKLVDFLHVNTKPMPLTIRTNQLKTSAESLRRTLELRGVKFDLNISNEFPRESGLLTTTKKPPIPLGASPEYLCGHYMLQGAASVLPALALQPKPGDIVLDLCAAPGGKATQLASLMKDTGTLIVNDASVRRIPALTCNIHRLGLTNCIVTSFDGTKNLQYPSQHHHHHPHHRMVFDKVLLDAPCSGTGILSRDVSARSKRTPHDIQRSSQVQKELIVAAVDALRPGGEMVYSTCSITVKENEEVIEDLLSKRDVKVISISSFPFGSRGVKRCGSSSRRFSACMAHARRLYPHEHGTDGFFIAKLRKISNEGNAYELAKTQEERSKRKKRKRQRQTKKRVEPHVSDSFRLLDHDERTQVSNALSRYCSRSFDCSMAREEYDIYAVDVDPSRCDDDTTTNTAGSGHIVSRVCYSKKSLAETASRIQKERLKWFGTCIGTFQAAAPRSKGRAREGPEQGVGKRSKSTSICHNRFHLGITALGLLEKNARFKLILTKKGTMSFVYGNDITLDQIASLNVSNPDDIERPRANDGVVIFSNDGKDVTASKQNEAAFNSNECSEPCPLALGFGTFTNLVDSIDMRHDSRKPEFSLSVNSSNENCDECNGPQSRKEIIVQRVADVGEYIRDQDRLLGGGV